MNLPALQQHLTNIIDRARESGLNIRLNSPGDLVVIGCGATTKQQLATVVALATSLGLRAKWCNEGTLVTIGVPTQKPVKADAKEGSQETTQSSQ